MERSQSRFNVTHYAIIILAAGNSSRLGNPKQLLTYKGKTLLQSSIDSAKEVGSDQVIVVLGANKDLIANRINDKGIILIENADWASGMASSIKTGIEALKVISPKIDAIILMVCDQPYADAELLKTLLLKQADTNSAIVGCRYENTIGTPALFHSSLFPELLLLQGDSGAKKLFEKYKKVASFVSFENGGIDIDTSEDFKNLPK